MHQEEAFVNTFIVPSKRDRYLLMMRNRKRRRDFLDRLSHMLDYDANMGTPVEPNKHTPADVEAMLQTRGAPTTCYVISYWPNLDGREMPLSEALDQVFRRGTSIVCCIAGELAYYEPETPGTAFILHKKQR